MSDTPIDATDKTKVGTYFVSNYPPYSFWSANAVPDALAALERPPAADTPLGMYIHIPFCRKRCRFCYFKVYTDKNARQVNDYLDVVVEELRLYSQKPVIAGRKPKFIYFGGGTPSYISTTQLRSLVDRMRPLLPWDEAEEVAFECEPGTLTRKKLEILKDVGITRLSLGVENFDDKVLEINGRAHDAAQVDKAYQMAREVGFPQINIDLIAGMIGETDENWRECIRKTIELSPDSVTIYQMELPPNTVISKEMRIMGQEESAVASWGVKRGWVRYAFEEMEKAGYSTTSAYTVVKNPETTTFLYRDLLWTGADMVSLGVASFAHIQGVHCQNEGHIERYSERVRQGELPIYRALTTTPEERMLRELILHMKKGEVDKRYFAGKHGVDLDARFGDRFQELARRGYLDDTPARATLTREGLLRADQLLYQFFLPQHQVASAA